MWRQTGFDKKAKNHLGYLKIILNIILESEHLE